MILYRKVIHPDRKISYEMMELVDTPISSGGEGGVFRLAGKDWWPVRYGNKEVHKRACAKIYNKAFLDKHEKELEKKLFFMIDKSNRPLHLDDGAGGLIQICYPFALLYNAPNGRFVGFLMYFALEGSAPLTCLSVDRSPQYYKKLREIGKLDHTSWDLFVKFRFPDGTHTASNRYVILFNIASVISRLHETGKYVIVDMKPDNFLISLNGGVSLVDVNSVQVSSGRTCFKSLVTTPNYIAPEMQKNPQGKKTVAFDLFNLAVIFYQVLTGTHPFSYSIKGGAMNQGTSIQEHIYSGKFACGKSRKHFILPQQHQRYDNLPDSIKQLFIRAFEGAARSRPSAREWMDVLRPIVKATNAFHSNTPIRTTAPPPPKRHALFAWKKACPICGVPYLDPDTSRYCYNCGTERK